ncbi:uncharacterized protein LOC117224181 [Megalopta genalis]|uniref:uncharacterized protein LOC117224181 n=1 Tax=Megalopta genalis TaxID=115081 RepID=UPI003FD2F6BA
MMKSAEGHKQNNMSQSFFNSRNLPDSCRGYQNKKVQYSSTSRSGRTPEAVTSCYSSSTSYKPGYVCSKPLHTKCVRPHSSDAAHDGHPTHAKLDKGKHYPSNVPNKGKIRYEDELINNEKFKYVDDELENMTEDNVEYADEEEDDRADTDEFLSKEYGEHEADDEIEESDSSPQPHRAQRACKKEAELRQLRWKTVGQQEDPRRLRCPQRVLAVGQGHSPTPRYYQHEHEVPEPLSEEDFVPTSMKSLIRRSMDHHHWSPSRGDPIRYDTASLPVQPSRRARTKPDMDQLLEAELGKTRQCHRCGSLSSKKPVSPLRNSCRFNNCTGFPTKGPIGENQERYDQLFCGHCVLRHNPELANGVGPHPLHPTKQRKPRDVKSPTKYQMPDQDHIEQLANDYSRTLSKLHRKSADHERAKRSLHTYGLPHLLSRYED